MALGVCTLKPPFFQTYALFFQFHAPPTIDLVKKGTPFRDAYREVAKTLGETGMEDPRINIKKKTHLGATGNLGLDLARKRLVPEREWASQSRETWTTAIEGLVA